MLPTAWSKGARLTISSQAAWQHLTSDMPMQKVKDTFSRKRPDLGSFWPRTSLPLVKSTYDESRIINPG